MRFHLLLAEDLSFMHAIDNLTELAFYWIVVRSTGALMGSKQVYSCAILCSFLLFSVTCRGAATEHGWTQSATLDVDASWWVQRKIPETLFGLIIHPFLHFLQQKILCFYVYRLVDSSNYTSSTYGL
jgi:hypothetical protein